MKARCAGGLLALAVLLPNHASGQVQTSVRTFEAASVKSADQTVRPGVSWKMKGGPGTANPTRITYTQVTLGSLMAKAWGLEPYRIAGPAWVSDPFGPWYNIEAVLPPETTRNEFQQMLQNLLIERFQIRLHHETRVFSGYELVLAPGGSKLKAPADPDAPEPATGASGELDDKGFLVLPPGHGAGVSMSKGGVHAKFQNYSIADLIASPFLSSSIRRSTGGDGPIHIADRTGLAGKYDFTVHFDARAIAVAVPVWAHSPDAASGSASDPSGLPNFFIALEKQLGLKLVKAKGFPLDTLVIDHVERVPTEN